MQGASSGLVLMGMQIGKVMGASLVIGTSTNAQRRAGLKNSAATSHSILATRNG